MSDIRRYRVVRCTDCNRIYPFRRSACSACGSTHRMGSLASRAEVERVGLLHGVALKEVVTPRGEPIHPRAERPALWRRLVPSGWARAPELLGVLRRR